VTVVVEDSTFVVEVVVETGGAVTVTVTGLVVVVVDEEVVVDEVVVVVVDEVVVVGVTMILRSSFREEGAHRVQVGPMLNSPTPNWFLSQTGLILGVWLTAKQVREAFGYLTLVTVCLMIFSVGTHNVSGPVILTPTRCPWLNWSNTQARRGGTNLALPGA